MPLRQELDRIAAVAALFAEGGEELAGVVPAEPSAGLRLYLCAFGNEAGENSWLVLDSDGRAVQDRALVRETVSIAGMCELAEDAAVLGDLDDLRSRLVALRLTENPPGIDEAEEAVVELQSTIGAPPNVASTARLDEVGSATRRLEQALGEAPGSPFSEAMQEAVELVQALTTDVEEHYKRPLA